MFVRDYRSRRRIHIADMDLCHFKGHSCLGCCVNLYEGYEKIYEFMKTNTEVFNDFFSDLSAINPVFAGDYLEEVKKVNPRTPLFLMYNCYYAGFLDSSFEKVGCLIHPLRCDNVEMRELVGVDCVPRGSCYRDILWKELPEEEKETFLLNVKDYNWFDYSQAVFNFIPKLYALSLLSPELPQNRYYSIVVRDRGIPVNFQLRKNLHLIFEYYNTDKEERNKNYLNQRELFYEFGELYLEEILEEVSRNSDFIFQALDIPQELIRDGDEFVNGERIYLLFLPGSSNRDKTVILGAKYDNSKEKLSHRNMKVSYSISFLIDFLGEIASAEERNFNYLFLFLGGETDVIRPLTGSFYFSEKLKEGFRVGKYLIKKEDVVLYMNFYNMMETNSFYSINYHLPSTREYLSDFEEYAKDYFYKDIYKPVFLDGRSIYEEYLISSLQVDDFPGIITVFFENIRKDLKKAIPLTSSKINSVVKKFVDDIFSLLDDEKRDLLEELNKKFQNSLIVPSGKKDYSLMEKEFLEKGFFVENEGRPARYLVHTHCKYREKLFKLLKKAGFRRKPHKTGKNESFYYFAMAGIPTISICGDETGKGLSVNKKFFQALLAYLKSLDELEFSREKFIEIVD